MGLVQEGFRQNVKIFSAAGQTDDLVDVGAGLAELLEQSAEAEGGEFSFEGVRGDHQIPFEAPDSPKHAAQTGDINQLQIHGIGKGDEF